MATIYLLKGDLTSHSCWKTMLARGLLQAACRWTLDARSVTYIDDLPMKKFTWNQSAVGPLTMQWKQTEVQFSVDRKEKHFFPSKHYIL